MPQEPALPAPPASDPNPAPDAAAWDYLDQVAPATPVEGQQKNVDLAELGIADSTDESFPKMSLYGFMDATFWYPLTSEKWKFYFPSNSTFWVGNINVYFASQMSRTLSSLLEVRFTYLPNGKNRSATEPQGQPYVDTSAADYTEAERPMDLGAIEIERAHFDYAPTDWFTLRVGQWLTPYGVWNVDHGSPTTIMAHKPYIVGGAMIPERQTGVLVQGALRKSAHRVGYGLGVSNGRGPLDSYYDMDSNKALTARLFWSINSSFGELTVGSSFYTGRYTDSQRKLALAAGKGGGLELKSVDTVQAQYDEYTLAGDLQWEKGGFRVISELLANRREYTNDGRPLSPSLLSIVDPSSEVRLDPDATIWGAYLIAGYRFDFFGTMPFVQIDHARMNDPVIPRTTAIIAGFNIRPHESVAWKIHYGHAVFPNADKRGPGTDPARSFETQLAWAF